MARSTEKWQCPNCPQMSSRYWNLKTHIRRKHNGIGQPKKETESFLFHYPTGSFFSSEHRNEPNQRRKEQNPIDSAYEIYKECKKTYEKMMEMRNFFQPFNSGPQFSFPLAPNEHLSHFMSQPSSIPPTDSVQPVVFTPQTDPLKDRIIGYSGYVCETCLANMPLAIYYFKENDKEVGVTHFCVPERIAKMQGVTEDQRNNTINYLHRTLPEKIKKAVKEWANNNNIYLISRRLPRIPENYTGFTTLPSNIDKDHWARRAIKENQILLNDNELLEYIRSANNKTFQFFYIQVNQDEQAQPYFMFISKDPVLPRLELKSLLLYDKFLQPNNSYFNTQENNSNPILNKSDSSECVTTGCNDEGYGIEKGEDDGGGKELLNQNHLLLL
jgi:hypothetical protein